tara:strand:+ start:1801 stop:2487 length:687 start_codon:yes stop_codon:yes gene_type:complete
MSNAIRLTTPTAVPTAVDKPSGLPVRRGVQPALPFVYAVYPRGWEFVEDFGFLPQLRKIIAKPGCNGVGSDGRLSRPLSSVVEKGGTVVSPEDSRLGDYQHYVRAYDTEFGGKWFVDFCQTATVLPTGEILWGVTEPDAWNKFRAHIRDSGIVPPMLAEIYEALLVFERMNLDQLADSVHGNPRVQAKYDALENKIESMQKRWAAERAALIAQVKPKTLTPKKAKVAK